MPGKSIKNHETVYGDCLDDDLLYRYLVTITTPEQDQHIEQHLNGCSKCFANVAALTEIVQTPITAAEEIEIARSRKISPEKQVQRILDLVKAGRPVEDQVDEVPAPETFWDKFTDGLAVLRQHLRNFLKPAIAWPAIILLLMIGGRPQYLAWRSQVFADRGMSTLAARAAIASREEPRPTGGFKYDEFGGPTRSSETKPVFDSVRADLEAAIDFKDKNVSAHHYLGTYYLVVEKNWARAKSEYLIALALDSTNASILNDLGVVAFYQGDYEQAIEQFSRALIYDSNFVEARFNLATLYQNLDRREAARQEWEKYLKLDPNSRWTEVARNRLEVL